MTFSIDQALNILKQYSCLETKEINSPEDKEDLQKALMLIVKLSDRQNIGICADNQTQALIALTNYLNTFGYQFNQSSFNLDKDTEKPVYIKFNTLKESFFIDDYEGNYRGVLITIFSENIEQIIGTYGYLPLNLFSL